MGRLVLMLVILLMMGTRPVTAELSFAGAGADYCSLVNSNATPGRDSSPEHHNEYDLYMGSRVHIRHERDAF